MAREAKPTTKSFLQTNVFDAALARIRWVFQNFQHVSVGFSGGKDSTVTLHLALKVAEEMGRLPLEVVFIDQEGEWQTVIDYIREVMLDPRVKPSWLQVPIKLFNATSTDQPWLHCWEPGAKWIRDKEPFSIHENVFGTEGFADMFVKFKAYHHPDEPCCSLSGMRAEESPARALGMTSYETYKGETWGRVEDKKRGHYAFYPIYDWSYTDVWKSILDNNWPYCKLYDYMYQYGIPIREMRVSNVHHETAVKTLYYLQEIEGHTWEKITERLKGVNTVKHMTRDFFKPTKLPFMFQTWEEYREHLLENLISDPEHKAWYRKTFDATSLKYVGRAYQELVQTHIAMLLVNDYHGTKLNTFHAGHIGESTNYGKNRAKRLEAEGIEDVPFTN